MADLIYSREIVDEILYLRRVGFTLHEIFEATDISTSEINNVLAENNEY